MLKVPVYNLEGNKKETTELPEKIFNVAINNNLIHQALKIQLANQRVPLARTKNRREVRGGGRKPWRQKGLGRARHGSIRSPIWRGGGITFGPSEKKDFKKKINKKAKRKALLMVLSSKLQDKELIVVEKLKLNEGKTKIMSQALNKILSKPVKEKKPSILLAMSKKDQKVIQANRNIPYTKTISVESLNILDLLSFKYLLLDKQGIKSIEKIFTK